MDTEEEMMIVRASQNGPYLTIKFEGKSHEKYDGKNQVGRSYVIYRRLILNRV